MSTVEATGTPDLASLIGNTPMLRLRRIASAGMAEIRVKLEGMNPGGSVKDRAARAIIQAAISAGRLSPEKILLDSSSGNTGIAYAMLCAERGIRCEICMPANANAERKRLLRAYGAAVVLTDALAGSDGAMQEAHRRVAMAPDRYYYADQYNNPANMRAHFETTGVEIWEQTEGRITHFVAALGTSGTFIGTGRRLREYSSAITLVSVQPDSPLHGIEGVKHMATAIVPGIYDADLADQMLLVGTEESQAMARRLARDEGILCGVSGGANVAAAVRVAAHLDPDCVVVTVLPDGGERYLSEPWWGGNP